MMNVGIASTCRCKELYKLTIDNILLEEKVIIIAISSTKISLEHSQ